MCERRQIDMGIRHSHLDAGRPFKHPGRNLQPTVRIGTAQAAAKNTVTRPLDRRVNADPKTKPRMPWVQQFSKLGSVGVLKLCCTTLGVHIRALTARHPIKPTSPRCHSAWQPNLGRRPTYRCGKTVQTTGTTSVWFPCGGRRCSKHRRSTWCARAEEIEFKVAVRFCILPDCHSVTGRPSA